MRECGKKKLVSEMWAREKRQARKKRREYSDKSYKKKKLKTDMINEFIRENTPSSLNDEPVSPRFHNHEQAQQEILNIDVSQAPTPNLRLQSARKRSRLQRINRNQELKWKNVLIVSLKQKLNKYKKRCQRLKKQKKQLELTPNSAMTKLAADPTTRPDVVKKALFGDALEKQISDNMTNLKTRQEKEVTNKLLLGETVKNRKVWKLKNKIITYKKVWSQGKQKKADKKKTRCLKTIVQTFLENDKYSRLCAGKKEFMRNKITKEKVQRRYRLDTLKNLHKEYLKSGNVIMSYSMFAKPTPPWIVAPRITDRDTCLCTVHANFQCSAFMPRKLQMKSLSCFCDEGIMCSHYRMGLLEYPAERNQIFDDVYDKEVSEQINCTSPDIINTITKNSTDQSDDISIVSDLTLNLENPEVLATMPDLQIDPTILLPDLSKETLKQKKDERNIEKQERKVKDIVKAQPKKKKKLISRKGKVKKATNYKIGNSKENSNLKKGSESKKYECSDCECLICGVLHSDDTTGNEWVQCLICHNWAQEGCIRGESALFKCSHCLADCDYKI